VLVKVSAIKIHNIYFNISARCVAYLNLAETCSCSYNTCHVFDRLSPFLDNLNIRGMSHIKR
jgi:hypothetical protein